jgi:lipoprotein-anchoring transpeptidase ErfK/SrfK
MIHGTNDPQSIGRAESLGCIRLDSRGIKDVYEILSVRTDRSAGSKVTIRR